MAQPKPLNNAVLSYFSRIEVIHLAARTDRLRDMTANLQKVGLPFTPGKVELFNAVSPKESDGFRTLGARGCFESHFQVLAAAHRDKLANVLVLEDDLNFMPVFEKAAPLLVEQLRARRWHFAYFGHPFGPTNSSTFGWKQIPPEQAGVQSHFIAIHGTVFERLLEFLAEIRRRPPSEGGRIDVDVACSLFRKSNTDVVALAAVPSMGRQRSSRSDVTSLPRWFDQVPIARELASFVRRVKTKIVGY